MPQRTVAFVCASPAGLPRDCRIAAFDFDETTGTLSPLSAVAHTNNPTFLAIDAARRRIFVAGETQHPTISSYGFDPLDGRFEHIDTQPTLGSDAAHVAINADGRTAFIANYSARGEAGDTGVLAYGIGVDGKIEPPFWRATFTGSGPVKGRQDSTHPHSTLLSPDQRLLVIPDLGADRLFCFDVDPGQQTITSAEPSSIAMPSGSGPRHAIFSRDGAFLYVVLELAGAVAVVDVRSHAVVQTISTLPAGFSGYNISADIQTTTDGTRLYVSNRGHDSIAGFAVDPADGGLTALDRTPVGGSWPRSFAFDPSGRFAVVANQKTDELVVFSVSPGSGALIETSHRMKVAQPMCIKIQRFE